MMASWSLDKAFVKAVHTALKLLHRQRDLGEHPLTRLTAVEAERRQSGWPDTPMGRAAALRTILDQGREALVVQDADAATLLERRFWRGTSVIRLADEQAVSESTLYASQNQAISTLARNLWELEQGARDRAHTRRRHLVRNLPPPTYTRLFGFDETFARLCSALRGPEAPWLISIEGLGGLGKTALAHRLATWAAGNAHFADIAWETAQRQQFAVWSGIIELPGPEPAMTFELLLDSIAIQLGYTELPRMTLSQKKTQLRGILKRQPYLIVVDNLETAAHQDLLVPQLWELANPTRFLITSRHSLSHHPHILCLTLNQLTEDDSLAFIRYEGRERGVAVIAEADEQRLRRIYAVTAGHPLAIKLVVGQARSLPLERALSRLRQASGQRASALYRFIYWQSWELLDEAARRLLLAMPTLATSGGYWENLLAVSDLAERDLEGAVQDLVAMSLLDAGGTEEKRYTIHPLTYTFIMTDLLGEWKA